MRKYGINAAIFFILAIMLSTYSIAIDGFSFDKLINIIVNIIIIVKLLSNKHDKFMTLALILRIILPLLSSINHLIFTIKYDQYHTIMPWFDTLAFILNIVCFLPEILIIYMSIKRNNCDEIEHPVIPAVLNVILGGLLIFMFTYMTNNSTGTFYYDTFYGIIGAIITTFELFFVAKFIQES